MKKTMANWATAADFINQTYGGGRNLVGLDSLNMSQPGIIEFRVLKKVFDTPDTFDRMFIEMSTVHGNACTVVRDVDLELRAWRLSSSRRVILRYKIGVGTYVQLIDDGEQRPVKPL